MKSQVCSQTHAPIAAAPMWWGGGLLSPERVDSRLGHTHTHLTQRVDVVVVCSRALNPQSVPFIPG